MLDDAKHLSATEFVEGVFKPENANEVKEPKEFSLVYESFVCSVCLTSSFSGYHRGFCCLSRMGCNRFGLHY